MRVGKKLWIQTPAKIFSVWGLITRPSKAYVNSIINEIRLLTLDEMENLFPDCKIIREKFFFFTKSYIAVRK